MSDRLRVDVDGGKYTVVVDQEGRLFALRYGEPWRECVGDNLIGCMAHELEELREHRADLLEACRAALTAFGDTKLRLGAMSDREAERFEAVLQLSDAIVKATWEPTP